MNLKGGVARFSRDSGRLGRSLVYVWVVMSQSLRVMRQEVDELKHRLRDKDRYNDCLDCLQIPDLPAHRCSCILTPSVLHLCMID